MLIWYDKNARRYRTRSADIGEGGYHPGVPYHCDDAGQIVPDERVIGAIVAGLMALGGAS